MSDNFELLYDNAQRNHAIWLGLSATPTIGDIEVIEKCFATHSALPSKKRPLIIEHVGRMPLCLPSMDDFKAYAAMLNRQEQWFLDHVNAIVVQTQKLDMLARLGKDIFLTLYTPALPFEIVEGKQEADTFLDTHRVNA